MQLSVESTGAGVARMSRKAPQRQVEVHPANIIQMLGRKWFDLKIDFSISNCCQNVVEEEVNSDVFFYIFQID